CDLAKKIESGAFREDLYYRLQGVTFTLPPLRERLDRCALIRQLAFEESDTGSPVELDVSLIALLEQQRWPGNLRQLRHLLRTMIALRDSDRLTVHDLPPEYRHNLAGSGTIPGAATGMVHGMTAAVPGTAPASASASSTAAAPGGNIEPSADTKVEARLNAFECAEREVLLQELKRHQWNLSGVARELNISRNTLYRKLQRLNIEHPDKSLFH
ncbi:MAG: sigma-54-dependent Fis family transcriptional regulator, partial [Massilia sp.]|nr:sigma-54-dependent Fis family transcriptional regulator [Massilia sp.]